MKILQLLHAWIGKKKISWLEIYEEIMKKREGVYEVANLKVKPAVNLRRKIMSIHTIYFSIILSISFVFRLQQHFSLNISRGFMVIVDRLALCLGT